MMDRLLKGAHDWMAELFTAPPAVVLTVTEEDVDGFIRSGLASWREWMGLPIELRRALAASGDALEGERIRTLAKAIAAAVDEELRAELGQLGLTPQEAFRRERRKALERRADLRARQLTSQGLPGRWRR